MYSDDYDVSVFKIKKEYMDMIDKIYDKMSNINDVINIIKKINDELKKNIESIREIIFRLSDDSRLRQVEINTINAKIDDALNFVWNKICRKNKISSKKINRDKHKDIDSYVSNKLDLLERVYALLCDIIREIEYKINMIRRDLIYRDMYKMGIDELHLINSKLNEIMRQSKKNLRNIISLDDQQQKITK